MFDDFKPILFIKGEILIKYQFLFICLFSCCLFFGNENQIRRIGLFIGASDGGESREKLKFTHKDVDDFSTVMQDLGGIQKKIIINCIIRIKKN